MTDSNFDESKLFFIFGEGKLRSAVDDSVGCEKLEKAMKIANFAGPMSLQRYLWSAICRGRNLICISPYQLGKTFGYVSAVLNVVGEKYFRDVEKFAGPVVLILVPTWKSAETAADYCRKLQPNLSVLVLYNGSNEDNENLHNILKSGGCSSVVVATPKVFLRIQERYKFALKRLQTLVFDDVENLLEFFPEQIRRIFDQINVGLATRRQNGGVAKNMQILAFGKMWTESVRQLGDMFCIFAPLILIYPWMEASVFAQIKTKAIVVKSSQKMDRLNDILKNHECCTTNATLVICCRNTSTSLTIRHDISNMNLNLKILFFNDDMTDAAFYANLSDDIDLLIHYDLGNSDAMTSFERRLALLKQHFTTNFENSNSKSVTNLLRQILLVTEKDAVQSPGIERYLRRMNCTVPKNLSKLVAGRVKSLHSERQTYQLCNSLKCLGRCPNDVACRNRHNPLTAVDTPSTFLQNLNANEVSVKIFRVDSPQRLFGRLTNNESIEKQMQDFNERIKRAFECKSNFFDPRPSEYCSFFRNVNNDESFFRGKVISVNESTDTCLVLSIDEGWLEEIPVDNIRSLPNDCATIEQSPLMMEIVLLGVQPLDGDLEWSPRITGFIQKRLDQFVSPTVVVRVGVKLTLANTVWAERVVVSEKSKNNIWLNVFDLKNYLFEYNFASKNENHLKLLQNWLSSNGFPVFNKEMASVSKYQKTEFVVHTDESKTSCLDAVANKDVFKTVRNKLAKEKPPCVSVLPAEEISGLLLYDANSDYSDEPSSVDSANESE